MLAIIVLCSTVVANAQTDDSLVATVPSLPRIPQPACSNDPLATYQVQHAYLNTCASQRFLPLVATVRIAIIDSGIDPSNPDVGPLVISNLNLSYSPTSGDARGHGTNVAALAAGIRNNRYGGFGTSLSKGTKLINIKVLGDEGLGDFSHVINGIGAAVNAKADVINMSLGCGPSGCKNASLASALVGAVKSGVFVAKSAGNSSSAVATGTEMSALSPMRGGMVVASLAATTGEQSWFSNFSTSFVDVGAPGSDGVCADLQMNSVIALRTQARGLMINPTFGCLSGTSMATPLVAGMAANVIAYHRQYGYSVFPYSIEDFIAPIPTEENPAAITKLTGKVRDGNTADMEKLSRKMPDFTYLN